VKSPPFSKHDIEVDEASDVLLSLRLLDLSMSKFNADPKWLKWVVISLHSAIQGAAICHLSGTMNTGALNEESAKNWIKYHNNRDNEKVGWPGVVVADFPELMGRVRSAKKKFDRNSPPISMTNDQNEKLKMLNSFRREFTHFSPKGWSIETSGTTSIVKTLLPIIREIEKEGWGFRHMKSDDKIELLEILGRRS
jgi:hypothetical protein